MKHVDTSSMNLSDQFFRSAAGRSGKTAIFHGNDQVSYERLARQAHAVALHLRTRLGTAPGDRVGIWMRNRPDFAAALFGALEAEAVVVPINTFLKPAEVDYILQDAGIGVLFADDELRESLGDLRDRHPGMRLTSVESLQHEASSVATDPLPGSSRRTPDDLAVLVYTSGTTGRPKGAMLTHGNLLTNVEGCRQILEVVEWDRFVLMLPMFHSFMLTVCVFLPLLTGGSVVLIRSLHPPKLMLSEIIQNEGSVLPAMAQVFRALAGTPSGIDLPLRLCVSGAGPLPATILEAFNKRFPCVPLIEGYGLSEASPVVSVNPVRGPWIPGTIGKPIPGVEVSIQDEEGRIVAHGTDGEICVRGGNVMRGYWRDPDKTAEAFRGDWLLTGDMGHLRPDGYFALTDRKKDMLKPNGLNVYPREIEEVIMQLPGVREAAVVGEPDERRGERPVAFVVMEDGSPFEEEILLSFLRTRLADYKVPKRAISLSTLPRNGTGKILKTHLRHLLLEPAAANEKGPACAGP